MQETITEQLLANPENTRWKVMARNGEQMTPIIVELRNATGNEIGLVHAKQVVEEYRELLAERKIGVVTINVSDDCEIQVVDKGNDMHQITVIAKTTMTIDSEDLLQTIVNITKNNHCYVPRA